MLIYDSEKFRCNMCGCICSNKPYEHMNGAGECTIVEAIIFDEEYGFCEKCSSDLRQFIKNKQKEYERNKWSSKIQLLKS